jgi:hypothetical protein
MHAACSWIACCLERSATNVEVIQVGHGQFDTMAHFEDGTVQFLRLRLDLQTGPRLAAYVEPVHP